MIPANFEYHRAATLDDAVQFLRDHPDAKLLAGGHSLLPAMKLRLDTPGHLLDISRISGLDSIRKDGDVVAIGPTCTHAAIAASDVVAQHAPLLAEAAAAIGDVQVRNKGTIGGSLAHADPAADYPAAILAADAQIVIKGSGGERVVDAADFFQGLFATALGSGEILSEIRLPLMASGAGASYQKYVQPASRFAIVGCAAIVHKDNGACKDVRVAFTGVADKAFRDTAVEDALRGQPLTDSSIERAAQQAAASVDPLNDHFASEDYRRHLARVFARRALMAAAERAS